MAKLLLAIDCSFGGHSVALADRHAVLSACHHPRTVASEAIIPSIERVLRTASCTLGDLGALAFGAGPGLFSGIRAACAVAQGIAFVKGLQIARVPTTLALAHLHGFPRALVAYPAHLRHCYLAAYVRNSKTWRTELQPVLASAKCLPKLAGDWQLCARRRSQLRINMRKCVTGKLREQPAVQGSLAPAIAKLGLSLWRSGKLLEPQAALPLYVRHKIALTKSELGLRNA